jgi:hypothetical protein
MMLDEMTKDDSNSKICRGLCLPNDGMWLEGPTETPIVPTKQNKIAKELSKQFHERRNILATHLYVWRRTQCKK